MIKRPKPSEYEAFYSTYIDKVPDGDVIEILGRGADETAALLRGEPEELGDYRYAPGKWTVREVIAHLADAERIFAYRALHMARADPAPLPGMDQDDWASHAEVGDRSLDSLLDELVSVREATVALFDGLSDTAWSRQGVASGYSFTVRAFPYIIAGHEIHHRGVLRERYLSS